MGDPGIVRASGASPSRVQFVGQYAVLGPYDYVNVVEAPDNRTIAKISMELGSRGTMEIMTLPAVNF